MVLKINKHLAKKCPTSVGATVFSVGSWIMNIYYWHLTAEIWHLAAFTSLICCVLPFTLPGCCCNGFLVMKSFREGKGREGKNSYWYIQVLDKGKDKFEKGLQNKTIQSQSFVPSFEITFMKKMFTCRYEVKPPVFGMGGRGQFVAWEWATFQSVLFEFQGLMLCSRGGHVVYFFTQE